MEEGLRYDAPVQGMFRTTTEDVEMHGVTLPAGARVFVAFGAANRDERIFAHPDRFDLWRPNADQHLTFGHGMHHCLGAPFVRLQARLALEVLVQRLPDLHLVPAQISPICRAYSTAPCNISRYAWARPITRMDNTPAPLRFDTPKPSQGLFVKKSKRAR